MDRISADVPQLERARVNYKVLWQEIRVVGYSGGYRNIRGNMNINHGNRATATSIIHA